MHDRDLAKSLGNINEIEKCIRDNETLYEAFLYGFIQILSIEGKNITELKSDINMMLIFFLYIHIIVGIKDSIGFTSYKQVVAHIVNSIEDNVGFTSYKQFVAHIINSFNDDIAFTLYKQITDIIMSNSIKDDIGLISRRQIISHMINSFNGDINVELTGNILIQIINSIKDSIGYQANKQIGFENINTLYSTINEFLLYVISMQTSMGFLDGIFMFFDNYIADVDFRYISEVENWTVARFCRNDEIGIGLNVVLERRS